jgi:hypothetical protein
MFQEKKPLTSEMLQDLPAVFQDPQLKWREDDGVPGGKSSSYTAYYVEGSAILTVDRRGKMDPLSN